MSYTGERGETSLTVVQVILYALVIAIFLFGGGAAGWKFLIRKPSHEKLTNIHYHGDWILEEYRICNSINLKEENKEPELYCGDASPMDPGRVFNVNFSSELTYDEYKKEGTPHYWQCRRNSADPAFSCTGKAQESQAQPQPQPLSPEAIEYFRKRNECESRFNKKGIYEIDGIGVTAACKEDPDRVPD